MSSNALAHAPTVDAGRTATDVADARPCVVFALGLPGPNRAWYLGRAATLGNLMRTSDPATARTWPTVAELEGWVEALPAGAKAQLADRDLLILPLSIEALPVVGTLTVTTTTPETRDTPAEHAVERRPARTQTQTPMFA